MDSKKEKTKQEIGTKRRPNSVNKLVELYVWGFIALVVAFPAWYYSLRYGLKDVILDFYNQFLLAILLILAPILFKLIFGKLPFEYLRSRRENNPEIRVVGNNNTVFTQPETKKAKGETYILECIEESKTISERIFSRSGVYLLVGCLIAFIGVAIFYSPIFSTTASTDISQRLLDYLPRFGALFFIEFIAFFFLKQYRTMLEEYRYYEAIKRKRQDNLNLIELIERHKDNTEFSKLLIEKISNSTITKLSNGETTEILEAQKLANQDLDIFSKITELVRELKPKQ